MNNPLEIPMRYATTVVLTLLLALPALLQAEDSVKIKGKYEVVGDLENLKGATQIEMIEFFNYSCGHCYKFLTAFERLQKKYKGKLIHKKQPIYWGKQTPYPAMAFFISDEQGIEKKFTKELFDTNFLMNINIFQPRVIKILAKDYGIEKEMTAGMQEARIKTKVTQSLALAKHYQANETPTVIINNTLKVMPSLTGGDVDKMTDNLEIIFDDILSH